MVLEKKKTYLLPDSHLNAQGNDRFHVINKRQVAIRLTKITVLQQSDFKNRHFLNSIKLFTRTKCLKFCTD